MSLLELRIRGLPSDLEDLSERQRPDDGTRRTARSNGAKSLLSSTKGAVLVFAVAVWIVAPAVSPPVAISPPSGDVQLQCVGRVRTTFDLIGTIYQLPEDTTRLPDFNVLAARGTVHLQRAELPAEVNGMGTYGVVYRGSFWISWPGNYLFRVTSDDGSKLFIDGRIVINNDGEHGRILVQQGVHLHPGRHSMRLEYFECCGGDASVDLEMCDIKSK